MVKHGNLLSGSQWVEIWLISPIFFCLETWTIPGKLNDFLRFAPFRIAYKPCEPRAEA